MVAGPGTLRPRVPVPLGRKEVLSPADVAGQAPPVYDEMQTSNPDECLDALCDEEERNCVDQRVNQRCPRLFGFLDSHPVGLDDVVAHKVSDNLTCIKHLSSLASARLGFIIKLYRY